MNEWFSVSLNYLQMYFVWVQQLDCIPLENIFDTQKPFCGEKVTALR